LSVSRRQSILEPPIYIPFFWENSEEALYKRAIFAEFFRIDNLSTVIPDISRVMQSRLTVILQRIDAHPDRQITIDLSKEITAAVEEIGEQALLAGNCRNTTVDGKSICQGLLEAVHNINSRRAALHPINVLTYGWAGKLGLIPSLNKGLSLYRKCERAVSEAYNSRSALPTDSLNTSIIDLMVKHNRSNPKYSLTEADCIGYMITFILAGVHTSTELAQSGLYNIAKDKDLQEKIRSEIRKYNLLREGVVIADLDKAEYVNCLFRETLRVYSPAPFTFQRRLMKDFTLGQYSFKQGDMMVVQVAGTMNSTQCTSNPRQYDYTRHAKDASPDMKVSTQAYTPFSMGKRSCIGQMLAEVEFKMIVMNIVDRMDISLPAMDNGHRWRVAPLYAIDHLSVNAMRV